MRLDIRSRNVAITGELRQHIERRVGQALNRFDGTSAFRIVLVDVNGPKGGPDKVCRVTVVLVGRGSGCRHRIWSERVSESLTGSPSASISAVPSVLEKVRRFDSTRSIRTAGEF